MTEWDVYWITRLDYIQGFFIGMSIAVVLAAVIMLCVGLFNLGLSGDTSERGFNLFKKFMPPGIFCILAACMTPDTKEFAAIKVIPAIANNQDLQDLSSELVDLGKEWLIELRPTTEAVK